MQVMFNNPILYVVAYPALNAVEVIDKRSGRGTLIRDEAAERFQRELQDILDQGDEADGLDEFINHFDALFIQPAIYH